jgi:hypothetical protein
MNRKTLLCKQVVKYVVFLIGFFLSLWSQTIGAVRLEMPGSEIEDPCSKLQGIFDRKEVCHFQIRSLTPQQAAGNALAFPVQRAETIPSRPQDGISGSEFARRTAGMSGADRQQAALAELRRGNIPEFLRNLKPVTLSYAPSGQDALTAVIWVMPDYLAIGSNEDFLRIPLTYSSATAIANDWGFILPTCHLKPEPLPPGSNMRSSEYYLKHRKMIRAQRHEAGCALGELTSGHKKDVVLTNLLLKKPGRLAIYGWHRRSGKPIQPLSTVHEAEYADYSHGVRLISQTVWIDKRPRSIFDVLQDPVLAPLLTYEGEILKPRRLMDQKR